MPKTVTLKWIGRGNASEHRPEGYALQGNGYWDTAVVSPVLSPGRDASHDPGSVLVAHTVDTETFNREVGWHVSAWHWSVVKMGGVLGAGDELTLEAARKAAETVVQRSLGHSKVLEVAA